MGRRRVGRRGTEKRQMERRGMNRRGKGSSGIRQQVMGGMMKSVMMQVLLITVEVKILTEVKNKGEKGRVVARVWIGMLPIKPKVAMLPILPTTENG